MKRIFRADTEAGQVENVVRMEHVSSKEYAVRAGMEPVRVLEDIDLLVRKAEIWGISGRESYEIRLLLEILANIKPYDGGRCVLVERGMMRHKRIILRHVFYIGSSDMPYDNMNVLEFLMFATARYRINRVLLQDQILETLVDVGLGQISLTPIHFLTGEEKAVVTLLTAAYSDCIILVFNLPEYEWSGQMIGALAKIADMIRHNGQTLIVGTRSSALIERACTHTAFLAGGRLIYRGTVEELRMTYDRVSVIIRDRRLEQIRERLSPLLPGKELTIRGGCLLVSCGAGEDCDPGEIYRKIVEAGFVPDAVEVNPKTVQNAYEEIVRQHDL